MALIYKPFVCCFFFMKRRLMGVETEIGLASDRERYADGRDVAQQIPEFIHKNPLTIDDFDPLFLEQCSNTDEFADDVLSSSKAVEIDVSFSFGAPEIVDPGYFLGNGERLYFLNNHLEISTRECDSVFEVAAADQADVRILDAAIKKFWRKNPGYGKLSAFKNTSSFDGNYEITWGGRHENYQMERSAWDKRDYLIPFLVTRQVFTGSGNIRETPINGSWKGFDTYFELSPRANFIEMVEGGDTQSNRPIIQMRDEPLINREKYRRFHLIAMDPCNCVYTTALAFGTTHLVLRLLEEIKEFKVPALRNPVPFVDETGERRRGAIQQVSIHPYSCLEFEDGGDKVMTAFQVQREFYYKPANKYFKGTNKETDWILDNWNRVLEESEKSRNQFPLDMVGLVEWFTRFDLLMRRVEFVKNALTDEEYKSYFGGDAPRSDKIDLSSEKDRRFLRDQNLEYDCIDMRRGLIFSIPQRTLCYPCTPEYVLQKIFDPCFSTRSSLRAFAISFYPDEVDNVNWDYLVFKNGRGKLNLSNVDFTDYKTMRGFYDRRISLDEFLTYCDKEGMLADKSKTPRKQIAKLY